MSACGLVPTLESETSKQIAAPPWTYDVNNPTCAFPLGLRLINVDDIRFTQSHIHDSFSYQMRPVMDMVNALLKGELRLRDIPVMRVAWRDGAFWSADNRRTFVFKHCKSGRVCVQVCDWMADQSREIDMKWRGGDRLRDQAAGGQRAGLVQRLKDLAFPRSEVIEIDMSKNDVSKLMDCDEQARHDEMVAAFAAKRQKSMELEDTICAKLSEPWHFEAQTSDARWLPATILEAYIDGTFDAIVLDGSVQRLSPGLVVENLRRPEANAVDVDVVVNDQSSLDMIVPKGMPTRLQIAWCAVCSKDIGGEPRKLRVHEQQVHSNGFQCSQCSRSFSCSDDLRKHSRSKQHAIPAAYGRHLRGSGAGECSDHEEGKDEQHDQAQEVCFSLDASSHLSATHSKVEGPVFVVTGASKERGASFTRCALCQCECSSKELSTHEEEHHKGEFECQTCHQKFPCSQSLRKHSRSKNHQILCVFMLDSERREHPASEQDVALACASNCTTIEDAGQQPPTATSSTGMTATCSSKLTTTHEAREQSSDAFHQADVIAGKDSQPETFQSPITFWWHAESNIRLMERMGDASKEVGSGSSAWADYVLERWRGAGERQYLYCPANQIWFWEDESEVKGWFREVR